MAIKKIIKIAKEIIKPKKTVTAKVIEEIKKQEPKKETIQENKSSLTKETN